VAPDILQALVRTIELKDLSTAAHTWRVVLYTRALAEHFRVDRDRVHSLTIGAALHDLGKLDVPDDILRKAGELTHEELEIMKTHPIRGHERLVNMGETDPIVLGLVRNHHERVDGRGYPDQLVGDAIPISARYFAVIDTFDALTSLRPYRTDVGPEAADRAIEELRAGIGSRYDAQCVEAFVHLYRRGDLDWILEYFNDRTCTHPFCREDAEKATRNKLKESGKV
jgi:HD-GYP domain-containing protein (c-di-GMP phosphodiesterase class II)